MKKPFAVFMLFSVLKVFAGVAAFVGFCWFMVWALQPNPVDTGFMRDEHSLRKMNSLASNTTSGGFFLLGGNFSSITETKLEFAWKLNEDTYILSSLPLKNVRVKIDNNAAVPTIRFVPTKNCWVGRELDNPEAYALKNCLRYAIVTVKDSDWPIQVNLPLNQPLPAEKE